MAKKYPYIWAWGDMMGSRRFYVQHQAALAEADGAPLTAINFKHNVDSSAPRVWMTLEDIQNPHVKAEVEQLVKQYL